MADHIKVFRHGKGTMTLLESRQGKKRHTIRREGTGHFLDRTFETVQSASDFCFAELRTDPAAIWYILEGDSIVKTVLDHAFQKEQEWKRARKYAFFSPLIFAVISSLVVTITAPFESTQANLGLVSIIVICYVLLLLMFGTRNLEVAILMTLILILLCMLIPTLRRAKERSDKAKHSLVVPSLFLYRYYRAAPTPPVNRFLANFTGFATNERRVTWKDSWVACFAECARTPPRAQKLQRL